MNKFTIKFDEIILISSLKKKSGSINIVHDDSDKLSISKRLELINVKNISIELDYKKINTTDILVNYKLNADGEQKCVVTLKPVKFNIKEIFTINFCDHSKLDLSSLEDEFIEPIYNSEINFSEIAIQMFYSFLDPYPKINNGNIKLDSFYKNKFGKNKNKNNPFEVLNNLNK
tara:strand:- start:691 stop:1209 length:519 start_codon:yes stop_codon:yes gene_type:complete